MSVPNQNLITINRDQVDMNRPRGVYVVSYWENLQNAMTCLTHSGLMIYLYLIKEVPHYYNNKPNEKHYTGRAFEFSPAAISKELEMARNSVINGFKDLINNGFLIPYGASNSYYFNELPPEQRIKVWGMTPEDYEQQRQETINKVTPSTSDNKLQSNELKNVQQSFTKLGVPTHL